MTTNELKAYVYEQKRQGRSDSQIARSLGMSLAHFIGILNGVDVDKVDPPKPTKPKKKLEKKPEVKSASGDKQKKNEQKAPPPLDILKPEGNLSRME